MDAIGLLVVTVSPQDIAGPGQEDLWISIFVDFWISGCNRPGAGKRESAESPSGHCGPGQSCGQQQQRRGPPERKVLGGSHHPPSASRTAAKHGIAKNQGDTIAIGKRKSKATKAENVNS